MRGWRCRSTGSTVASADALRRGGANDPAALFADPEITFGEEAVRQHLADPHRGYFVKSPKSFLGADIKQQHIDLFAEIITRILAHIKQTAEAQVDDRIDAVCLGRPVRFHGLRGEDGNRQAVAILERAAVAAGFGQVEFLFEPIAAAMKEVETQSGVAPDVIYVTGGTAKSPMIEECIRANYRGVDIVVGDLFGSVTSGLATWAHRIFR